MLLGSGHHINGSGKWDCRGLWGREIFGFARVLVFKGDAQCSSMIFFFFFFKEISPSRLASQSGEEERRAWDGLCSG